MTMPPALVSALIGSAVVLSAISAGVSLAVWRRVRMLPGSEDHARLSAELAALRRGLETTPRPRPEPTAANVAKPSRGGAAVGAPTLIAVPDLASTPAEPSPASAELGRRFGAIWAMADAGAPAEAIARRTGQPIGQVELILGLRRQLEAATAGSQPA